MIPQGASLILLSLLAVASVTAAQEQPDEPRQLPTNTAPFVHQWKWFEKHRDVTKAFPTDYRIGGTYRLKKDVVVHHGGTDSPVTKYFVDNNELVLGSVKAALRDPKAAKEREIQALIQLAEENPRMAPGMNLLIRDARNRRETRSILSEGTKLRFQQIALSRSFPYGVMVHSYAEILDGPLRGKWIDVGAISVNSSAPDNAYCSPDSRYLEYAGK